MRERGTASPCGGPGAEPPENPRHPPPSTTNERRDVAIPGVKERKTLAFALEKTWEEDGENAGFFSGYASVFGNVDDGDDVVEPGAFAKTLAGDIGRVKILSGHDEGALPIGRPVELREDGRGLYIRGRISGTALGRDIMTLLRDGVLSELSIGFDPVRWDHDAQGVRHLREVRLWEVSIVTWGMNPRATVTARKALGERTYVIEMERKNVI